MIDDVDKTEDIEQSEENMTTSTVPVRRQLLIVSVILLLIFGTGYVPKVLSSINIKKTQVEKKVPTLVVKKVPVEKPDFFKDISINARSAYVWDVRNQRALYKKDPDIQLPLASVTKLMTALVAHELITDNENITITDRAVSQEGNSGLAQGEQFKFKNLLDLTLLSSSNDGAFAIATAVGAQIAEDGDASTFVEAMNIRAKELGLTQTYYRNPTGLDISETEGGAYGSARDMTFLMEYILSNYPEILSGTQTKSASIKDENGAGHLAENTNKTIDKIPGLIGSKTGYTLLANGNLVIAFDAALNRPIIVVVLDSTFNGRFTDVLALSRAARKTVQN